MISVIKEKELVGKIKQVKQNKYQAIISSSEIIIGDGIDEIGAHELRIYNRNNLLIRRQTFEASGSNRHVFNYDYDNQNNLSEETWLNSDNSFRLKIKYKYDDKNNLTEKCDVLANGFTKKEIYSYNEMGVIINSNIQNSNSENNCKYDEKGNILEENRYDHTGKLTDNLKYKYDLNGNKIERTWLRPAWDISAKSSYEYNENDLFIKETIYNKDGSISSIIQFVYEYDKNRNWIKKIELKDNEPKFITIREIDYFD